MLACNFSWLVGLGFAVVMSQAVAQPVMEHGMGFVAEPDMVYKSFPGVPRFRAFLPPEADLSGRFPTPGNQGKQGSCTAWAVGYGMRSYYEGQANHRENFTSEEQVFSPAYIYNRLHEGAKDCHDGTAISHALDLLVQEGVPPMSEFPYSADDCSRTPGSKTKTLAANFRIKSWRAIEPTKLDDAKGQINAGNPVVFGMNIAQNFNNLHGDEIYDDTDSPRIGGHAMVLVGYSEKRQAFKLLNSWGTNWGDHGFGWVSYRAIKELGMRLFVADAPAAVTPNPPPVPPTPVVVVTPPVPIPPTPVVVIPPVQVVVVDPPPAPVVVITPPAPTPTPTPPVVVIPVPPPPPAPVVIPLLAATREAVAARLNQVSCARIESALATDRIVHLSGFVGSAEDMEKLRADVQSMPGVRDVDANVVLRPWPQCEVYLSFDQALSVHKGLDVKLLGASGDVFKEGDSMSIEVATPNYPSYVYVTYLQASGDAVHLQWPNGRFPKPLPPNTKITFGGGKNGEPAYRIGAPFGDEIVVAVASASPLFPEGMPEAAIDREYLTSFRRTFLVRPKNGAGNRVVTAVAVTLKTQPH